VSGPILIPILASAHRLGCSCSCSCCLCLCLYHPRSRPPLARPCPSIQRPFAFPAKIHQRAYHSALQALGRGPLQWPRQQLPETHLAEGESVRRGHTAAAGETMCRRARAQIRRRMRGTAPWIARRQKLGLGRASASEGAVSPLPSQPPRSMPPPGPPPPACLPQAAPNATARRQAASFLRRHGLDLLRDLCRATTNPRRWRRRTLRNLYRTTCLDPHQWLLTRRSSLRLARDHQAQTQSTHPHPRLAKQGDRILSARTVRRQQDLVRPIPADTQTTTTPAGGHSKRLCRQRVVVEAGPLQQPQARSVEPRERDHLGEVRQAAKTTPLKPKPIRRPLASQCAASMKNSTQTHWIHASRLGRVLLMDSEWELERLQPTF